VLGAVAVARDITSRFRAAKESRRRIADLEEQVKTLKEQHNEQMSSSAVGVSAHVLRYAAFTDDPGGGNPAGVVLDARGLDEAQMLQVAREVGYSETAFLRPCRGAVGEYDVRYFSP
jgi:Phenazine biosynthesis-like protein